MTDITELAQSLKAAAEKAIAEEGSTWWSEEQLASDYGLALHRTDAKFIALASHENVLALVEALEKAQQRISEISDQKSTWVAWAEDASGMVDMLRLRIAELESSTVKLPDDAEHDIMAPVAAYLSEKFKWDGRAVRWDGRNEYDALADRVKYALRMVIRRAAGIKVETE